MISQYRDDRATITLKRFSFIDGLNNFTFKYMNDERNETVFPGIILYISIIDLPV